MSAKTPFPEMREQNPITRAKHKQQIFWQIQLPLIGVGVLVIIAIIVVLLASTTQIATWANISVFYMGLTYLILALVMLIISIGASYLLYRANRNLPFLTFQWQRFLFLVKYRTEIVSNKATEPFLRMHGFMASGRALFRGKRDTKPRSTK